MGSMEREDQYHQNIDFQCFKFKQKIESLPQQMIPPMKPNTKKSQLLI